MTSMGSAANYGTGNADDIAEEQKEKERQEKNIIVDSI